MVFLKNTTKILIHYRYLLCVGFVFNIDSDYRIHSLCKSVDTNIIYRLFIDKYNKSHKFTYILKSKYI